MTSDLTPKVNRRHVLTGMAGIAGMAGVGALASARPSILSPLMAQAQSRLHPQTEHNLISRRTSFALKGAPTQGLVSLEDNAPPPVLRVPQGQPAVFNYTNGLDDYSTMHWHGIRLPNEMDGVPYLTQFPVGTNETFRYAFTPPDAGTYWYHPHCMTMEQMASGLTGVLIVDEAEDQGFDADIVLNLKDFRLDADSALLPYFTPRGAARSGTLGNLKTTNWQSEPIYDVPAGGLIRIRIAVTDTTRIHKLVLPEGSKGTGQIIAWDGHPVDDAVPWPTLTEPLLLGPGQRVDIAMLAPASEGQEITLTGLAGKTPFTIAALRAVGQGLNRSAQDIKPLPRNPVGHPDIANASTPEQTREIVFGWSPDGDGQNNGLCGISDYTFWSINRTPWPGDVAEDTQAVATLELGKSHIFRLRNESPNMHPIHLHGLVFKPLRSNLRKLPANYTDTLLLLKNEIVDIALVADNLGDWAFHCHVIEHQKTGLAGFIRVV